MCLSSWELREDELNNREEELLDFVYLKPGIPDRAQSAL